MKQKTLILLCLLVSMVTRSQGIHTSVKFWRVVLVRKDGIRVPFQLEQKTKDGKTKLEVVNGAERIQVTGVRTRGDSLFFTMPAFESSFKLRILPSGDLSGVFVKGTSGASQFWSLYGEANRKNRFAAYPGNATGNITGNWDVTFTRPNGTTRKAVGIFKQEGNAISGSFLTPSSDNRYLEGIVSGDSVFMSGFDGDNIHLFVAKIQNNRTLTTGIFYNGFTAKQTWVATKVDSISLPKIEDATRLRPGASRLNFTFPDFEGKPVSILDPKYKNKVVILQIMGSWCANCHDETKFLSDYYKKNRSKGIEIIAIAYELTTNAARSRKNLEKFKKLYDVQYPILISGAAAGDDQKTEKTLPQLTPIRSFPTTIFIDRHGIVKDIHTNFYGPASGKYYIESKRRFYETVDRLLKE